MEYDGHSAEEFPNKPDRRVGCFQVALYVATHPDAASLEEINARQHLEDCVVGDTYIESDVRLLHLRCDRESCEAGCMIAKYDTGDTPQMDLISGAVVKSFGNCILQQPS